MKRIAAYRICLLLLLLALTGMSSAQVAIGTPPLGSFGGGPFDVVNLGNLNVHFSVPIFQRSGRGISFHYNINYDSSIWTPVTSNGTTSWHAVGGWGWQSQTNAFTGYLPPPTITYYQIDCGTPPHHIYEQDEVDTYNGFVDPLGTLHGMHIRVDVGALDCGGQSGGTTGTTTDGSGYTITVFPGGSATVALRSGISETLASTFKDTNGNELTTSGGTTFYDTLSSTTPVLTISGNAPSPVSYKYTSPQNVLVGYTVNYVAYTVKTAFGATLNGTAIGEYGPTTISLVDHITQPDGGMYSFQYEATPGSCTPNSGTSACVTGRILKITLPSGGTITYGYTGGANGIENDGSTAGLTRTLSPGSGQWQYSRAETGTGPLWTTTVTDPIGNQTVINFSKDSAASYPTQNFYEIQRQVYQGSSTGTLLLTLLTCYNGVYTGCAAGTATVSSPIALTDVFREVPNGSTTKTSASETQYNGFGLVWENKQYDFGVTAGSAPSSTLLLTDVATTYGSWNGTACVPLNNNIVDRPCQIAVKNGAGTVKAQTSFTYDQGTPTSTTSPQHVSVSGSRGNPTTVASLTSGTSTLTKTFTYYDTGNVNTATDVNGAVTTTKYLTGSCGNSFPTEVDLPLSLIKYLTWDTNCAGAVMVSSKDVNGNVTTYSYGDTNFWRQTGITYPDGGGSTTTYNTGTTSPWNIVTSSKKDSTTNVTGKTILDGFARTTQKQMTSDPSGTDYVDTAYDSLGRVASVSNSYRTTSDPTYGITQYAYDALNRTKSVTHPDTTQATFTYIGAATQVQDEGNNSGGTTHILHVNQADGLGRLTSVCEVSSTTLQGTSGAPTACGQDIAATGFLTAYQYDALGNITSVTQPGVNSRTYTYDGLSRLTQEINPESGTTSYSYDNTGQKGDLYQRTRPKENQNLSATVITTYTYDLAHRLTGKSYNDSLTPSVTLSYDQTSVGGVSPANPKGQLTNAVGAGGTASTIFSYDSMGRIAQEWQCTPLNCGTSTFSLQYQYDYLGDVTQLVNGRESATYTYSYDAAARLIKLQSSLSDSNHPGTLLTVNTYNPLSEIQQETLGNGIVRNVQYDNRGRATSSTDGSIYSFTVGYAPDGNILTGNDSVNGNWTYTSDSMGRIATSGKTGLAFSYTYDPAGNRWQQNVTAGSGPSPQYTFDLNNHLITFSYDAAGNLMNDAFHNYTYDAEGRLLTVDSTVASYTYDALGQRVRSTLSSTPYDFIFNGGKAIDKVTASSWVWGNAGGSPGITYTNGSTYFDHVDWLGTVRARTNVSGASIETCTSLAFGDGQSCTGTDESPQHFTGLQWDSESNLQHAWFRQESTTEGRWTVPDPSGLAAVSPGDPQSWNRYAYVDNNATGHVDPLGLLLDDCFWYGNCGGWAYGNHGYYGSGSSLCTLDGWDVSCGSLSGLGSNAIALCPNNRCAGFDNGVYIEYTADANNNGFYSCLATGSFATQQQAGVAAAGCANGASIYYNLEYVGNIYKKDSNGQYSFTLGTAQGPASGTTDFSDIPDGTEFAGFYHTHGAFDINYLSEQFSGFDGDIGVANSVANHGFPTYLGTPQGRIEMYSPAQAGAYPYGCVLVGSSVSPGAGISTVPVPSCP